MADFRLNEAAEAYVRRAMQSGRYADPSELIDEALALHALQRDPDPATLEELRAAVRQGIADLDAGRFTVVDSRESFRRAIGLDDE